MIAALNNFLLNVVGPGLTNLILALLILIIGYVIARLIAGVIRRLLRRTNLDNRLADALSPPDERRDVQVEDTIGKIVFWLLFLFVLLAFFQQLGMSGLAAPLQAFLNDLTAIYLPRLFAAGLLLLLAWLVATALRWLVSKGLGWLKLDERMSKYGALEEGEQVSFSETLAIAVYWFVFLLFLPAVLNALGISAIAEPINNLVIVFFDYIPNVLSAALIFAIGFFVARIIRNIIVNLLVALGADKFGERLGLSAERTLSDIVGTIIYIIILIVTIIASLDALNIAAISDPVGEMLSTMINVIPNLIGAALILVIAYFVARLVANLVRDLLATIGFDSLPEKLGLKWSPTTSPSQWVGYLVILAIILFAATTAAEMLGSAFLVNALDVFITFFWRVVLAVVFFAIGLYFANLAYRAIVTTGVNQANFMGRMAQIAIIIFAAAIALREVGVASDIINLAFGIALGAIGLAVALSFGLGTRAIAERETDNFLTIMRGSEEDLKTEG